MLIYGHPIGSSVLFGLLFAALFFGLQCLCFRSGRKYLCFLPLCLLPLTAAGVLLLLSGFRAAGDLQALTAWFLTCTFLLGLGGVGLAWLLFRLLDRPSCRK